MNCEQPFDPSTKAHFIFCKPWIEEMVDTCTELGLLQQLDKTFDLCAPTEVLAVAIVAWIYNHHKEIGHPVIEPDIQLARALAEHTDFDDMVDVSLPKMPHDFLWITFPPGFDIYLNEVLSDEKLRVAGAYIARSQAPNGAADAMTIYLWAPPKHGREMGDDRFSYLSIWPGVDLKAKLDQVWIDGEVVNGDVAKFEKSFSDKEKEDWGLAIRMIIGTLLYMQCDGAIVDAVTPQDREESFAKRHGRKRNLKKGKAGRERKALDQYGHSTIIYVGSGWGKTEEGEAFSRGQDWDSSNPESKRRHWVRGHFRNQAHGEGRRLRKRIFIAPHQRGDEDKIESDVTYKVKGTA